VIVAVDSMTARQEVWKRVKLDKAVPLLVDARMERVRSHLRHQSHHPDDGSFTSRTYIPPKKLNGCLLGAGDHLLPDDHRG